MNQKNLIALYHRKKIEWVTEPDPQFIHFLVANAQAALPSSHLCFGFNFLAIVVLRGEHPNLSEHLAAHFSLPLYLPQRLLWKERNSKQVSPLVLEVHRGPPLNGLEAELLDVGPLPTAADANSLDEGLGLLGCPWVVVLLAPVAAPIASLGTGIAVASIVALVVQGRGLAMDYVMSPKSRK